MWDKIVRNYEGDDKLKKENLQTFWRQFEILKMSDEEDVVAYFLWWCRGIIPPSQNTF